MLRARDEHSGGEKSTMKVIRILPSKSEAHRMLIAASLCEEPCEIQISETSNDIEATGRCMKAIRKAMAEDGTADLYCGESGSTFRFLIPIVAALGINGRFHPEGRLPERPLSPLDEEMRRNGAILSQTGTVPYLVQGKLQPGHYEIPGNVSSQYITGLLFALPILDGDSTISVTGTLQSEGYVNMTLRVLGRFGIEIITERSADALVYRIPGNQKYTASGTMEVEGDWSNAAFWLAAGVLGEEPIQVTGLSMDSAQGDRRIVELLQKFGAEVQSSENAVTAYPSRREMHGISIDASQIPDMVPALALVASLAKGTTEIHHAERLRLKESDRLQSVTDVLSKLGADVKELTDGLIIEGTERLVGAEVNSYNDHRIAMMAAIASLVTEGRVAIQGAESVNKSYPTFFTVMDENNLSDNIERR